MRTMTRFAVIVTTMALYWVVAAAHAVAADPAALQRTGTGHDVPALAPLLLREDLTMSARLALQAIPGLEAGEALRAAVEKTSGLIKVGIIDSLGARREVAAVATLTQALSDADPLVVGAAGLALGKIGTPECAQALAAVADKIPAASRSTFCDGYLLCADRLAAAGKAAEAHAIYQRLAKPAEARAVRQAAFHGLLCTAGDKQEELVVALLTTGDADARSIASGHLGSLSSGALRMLVGKLGGLPPRPQAALLTALAARGEKSALPAVLEATKSQEPAVRLAAFEALAELGDASAVPALIAAMTTENPGAEQRGPTDPAAALARRSLVWLKDPAADLRIMAALENAKVSRAELIGVLAERQSKAAVPVFLKAAAGADEDSRNRAVAALARLAAPSDVPAMLGLVLNTKQGVDRDNVEKAVMLVCRRIPDREKRADAVLAAAGADDSAKSELLPLLGRIGGRQALEAIRAAMDGKDAQINEAGVRALCNWPDATVADELLRIAKSAARDTHRQWALRAFVRVIALPSETPAAAKLALLKQALPMAARDEERGLILERAAAVRTLETLRFVTPYLDQTALAQAACKTVVELAHHKDLREPNKAEFTPALEKVIAVCKDQQLVDRAKRYLQGM